MIGEKFGRWTVLEFDSKNRNGRNMWKCECECGVIRVCLGDDLRGGRSKSCGCFMKESVAARALRHGMSKTGIYKIWADMKRRCLNQNAPEWPDYGGRGIKLCDSWHQFENFYKDMGERPFHKATLDRTNNDGDYTPENCRWVTNTVNNRNKRKHRMITYNGETLCSAEWAERAGIAPRSFRGRLRRGWSMEKAMQPALVRGSWNGSHRSVIL